MQRWMWAFLLGPLVGLLAVGCATPQSGQRSSGDSGPRRGGVMNLRYETDPSDFDLSFGGKAAGSGVVLRNATESLLTFEVGPDVGYMDDRMRPSLAESWE